MQLQNFMKKEKSKKEIFIIFFKTFKAAVEEKKFLTLSNCRFAVTLESIPALWEGRGGVPPWTSHQVLSQGHAERHTTTHSSIPPSTSVSADRSLDCGRKPEDLQRETART